jgi:hypothetical protein
LASSSEIREAAERERDRLSDVVSDADLAMVLTASMAAVTDRKMMAAVAIPAFLRWRASKEKIVQQRLVDDPPREDYREPANINPVAWEAPPDLLAGDDTGTYLGAYVISSIRTVSYEEAMIEAIEKQQGALQDGEDQFARRRAAEAEELADSAARALHDCAELLPPILDRWPAPPKPWTKSRRPSRRAYRTRRRLPQGLVEDLERLGIPGNEVARIRTRRRPGYELDIGVQLRRSVLRDAEAKEDLARVLRAGTLITV